MSAAWVRSSSCSLGNCLELLPIDGADLIGLRSSTEARMHIYVTRAELAAFIAGARLGDFDHLTGASDA